MVLPFSAWRNVWTARQLLCVEQNTTSSPACLGSFPSGLPVTFGCFSLSPLTFQVQHAQLNSSLIWRTYFKVKPFFFFPVSVHLPGFALTFWHSARLACRCGTCALSLCVLNIKPWVGKEQPLAWVRFYRRLCTFHVLLILFWQHYSVYPLCWQPSPARPSAWIRTQDWIACWSSEGES